MSCGTARQPRSPWRVGRAGTLLLLAAVGCFHSLDRSNIVCDLATPESCPSGLTCVPTGGSTGRCSPGADASSKEASIPSGIDVRPADALDGPVDLDVNAVEPSLDVGMPGDTSPDSAAGGSAEAGPDQVARGLDTPINAGGTDGGVDANTDDVPGNFGTGGVAGSGGVGSGGVPGTGGTGGTTHAVDAGSGGILGSGGVTGTGGMPATGGVPGTGGTPATGGVPGTGGAAPGTGGSTAPADAAADTAGASVALEQAVNWSNVASDSTTGTILVGPTLGPSYVLLAIAANATSGATGVHVTSVIGSGLSFSRLAGGNIAGSAFCAEFWGSYSPGTFVQQDVNVILSEKTNVGMYAWSLTGVNATSPVGQTSVPRQSIGSTYLETFSNTRRGSMLFGAFFDGGYNWPDIPADVGSVDFRTNVIYYVYSNSARSGGTQTIGATMPASWTIYRTALEIVP